tara:strand:+ start:382 stop:564 length:183 start_codon:yes stop_codon:yes gene_type:complete
VWNWGRREFWGSAESVLELGWGMLLIEKGSLGFRGKGFSDWMLKPGMDAPESVHGSAKTS